MTGAAYAAARRAGRNSTVRQPIAIVGIGCRFPGESDGPERFFTNLVEGRCGIVEIPPDRWSLDGFYDPDPEAAGRSTTKWGGFLKNIELFDAAFFGISPREAADLDPQQRLMLRVAWEALEDAGIAADRLAGTPTGVFVGVSINDYAFVQKLSHVGEHIHAGTGTALSIVANRISHRFDLRGPSVSIDTACSSSLVAVHLACRSLWEGESTLALAGGVNALLDPGGFLYFSKANMMSPDGRMRPFDAGANGFVRAEGAGVVALKPLSAARAAGDRIYAVIRATAVNQDGCTSTITVPSQEAQAAMMREACRVARVNPARIAYVEAHGTGTRVGDPIEAAAIGEVFGRAPGRRAPIRVGSVKAHTGHLESAAGITGLIKTALAVHHRRVPANLDFESPNPAIPFDELNLEVVSKTLPLKGKRPLVAINSFGFGGTNACAILEAAEAPAPAARTAPERRLSLVPLSAASAPALAARAADLARFIADQGETAPTLTDLAGTLALRRAHLNHRLAVVACSTADLAAKLDAFASGRPVPGAEEGAPATVIAGRRDEPQGVVFLFAGQGGQSWRMARELLSSDSVFGAEVARFDAVFRRLAGWSVLDELMADEAASRVDVTHVTQPAIFAVQIGLVARWRAWGIEPAAVIGHSFGEVAAAHTAGALSLEDAAAIVYHRGRLQDQTQGSGGMAAVAMAAEAVRARLAAAREERVEIAAVNGPSMVTLAGDSDALQALIDSLLLEEPDLFCRMLKVDYAAHSRQMESIREPFVASLAGLEPRRPTIPMISTVTGAEIGDERLDADYWWRNVRLPVQFQDAMATAAGRGLRQFIEIGPHATLSGIASACLLEAGTPGLVVPSLHAKHGDLDVLLAALAALYVRGQPARFEEIVEPGHNPIRLPRYPWEEQRFWADSEELRAARFDVPVHPLLGRRLKSPQPIWAGEIDLRSFRYLTDHRVDGAVVFPGAGYVEMILAAARDALGELPFELEQLTFHEALFLQEDRSVLMQTVLDPARGLIQVFSRQRDGAPDWTLRVSAHVRQGAARAILQEPAAPAGEPVGREAFYAFCRGQGHEYGPLFQLIEELRADSTTSVGTVALPDALADSAARYLVHPVVLDACFQVGIGVHTALGAATHEPAIHLPTSMTRLRLYRRPGPRLRAEVRVVRADARGGAIDIAVFDADGDSEPVFVIEGFASRRFPARSARAAKAALLLPYQESWHEAALETSDEGEAAPHGLWLVLADEGGVGTALARGLAARGHTPLCVRAPDTEASLDEATIAIDPADADDMERLLGEVTGPSGTPLVGIVHLWSLDGEADEAPDDGLLMQAQARGTISVLHLVQSLARREELAPRLWIATRGVRSVPAEGPGAHRMRLAHAPLAGLARTIANEHPQLGCSVIDLDPARSADAESDAADLLAEIIANAPEPEIARRGDGRYVNRIDATAFETLPPRRVPAASADPPLPFRLTMSAPGVFDNMLVAEADQPRPGPGEIAVSVRAVGLNFHDVLSAAGMMPEGAEDIDAWEFLGLECAGVVSELGQGVEHLQPGDAIMTPGKGCLASSIVVPAALVQKLPPGIGFVEATTLPTAFMTTHYALNHVGRMRAGERVLIHVATGGVGLAAIQLARLKGCEIFATAGSERKRAYLREHEGIAHVMDSRSLDFADEIMALTGGRGVDIVLNSLPGAFIDKGLAILAPYGRFLELGKRDLFGDKPIGLRALRNGNLFVSIDLDGLGRDRPHELAALFAEVGAMLADGRIHPLPAEAFPLSRVAEAFRHMSQARHIGKVVVTVDDPALEVALSAERPLALRADGAYLVTGGLGGFGLEVARWLGRAGAGQLILMGRSGAASDEARQALAEIEAGGTAVTVIAGDVTRTEDVTRAIAAAMHDLRGVVHAAMVLDDGFITQLDDVRFERALAPKMLGAWNLHRATLDRKLDFFVLFSSVAALIGSPGQANYVAGNAFLDALVAARRSQGLPALSVAWGALGGAGFVARNEAIGRYLESLGIAPIALDEALAALGRLLRQDAGCISVLRMDWGRLAKAQGALASSPRIAHLLVGTDDGRRPGGRIRAELLAAPAARRPALVGRFLREQVARVLRAEAKSIEEDRPLNELGLDSLTSFELKNRIENELGVDLPTSKFLQRPTVAGLGAAILERLEAEREGAEEAASAEALGPDEPPLSSRQEWLWRLEREAPGAVAFLNDLRLGFAIGVRPRVEPARFAHAFEETVARHPILRTCFPAQNGRPVQRVLDRHPHGAIIEDSRALSPEAFRALLVERLRAPFDLEAGPLLRLELHHRDDDQDVILLAAHHSIVDGWALMLFVGEMFATYFGAGEQQDLVESDATFEYVDFARWQRALMAGPEGEALLAYWRARLSDPGPALDLPYDRAPRPGGVLAMTRGGNCQAVIGADVTAAVAALARQAATTPYVVMLAAFKALIFKYSGRTDLLVTATVAGRTRPEFERIIGWFGNLIVFRSRIDPQASFRSLIDQLAVTVLEGLANQDCPAPQAFAAGDPDYLTNRTALNQVGFCMTRPDNLDDRGFGLILLNSGNARMEFGGIEIESIPVEACAAPRDLTISVQEFDGRVYVSLDYNADAFDHSTAARIAADYEVMLRAALGAPDEAVANLAARPGARADAAAAEA